MSNDQLNGTKPEVSFQIFLVVMADFKNRDDTLRESNISHRLGSAKMIQTKTFSE